MSHVKKITIVLGLLLVLSAFNTSSIANLKSFGFLTLASLLTLSFLLLMFILVKKLTIPKITINILNLSIVMLFLYSLAIIIDGFSLRGVTNFVQLFSVFGFFVCMSFVNWDNVKIYVIGNIVALFIALNYIVFTANKFSFPFKSFAGNENVFSALMFYLAFFPILNLMLVKRRFNKMIWFMILAINIVLVIAGHARSIWLALLICAFVFMLWNRITSCKVTFYSFFLLVILALFVVTILYPSLSTHPNASLWNQYVRQYTGANLFSGRERLWQPLIELIKQKPLLGYGASAVPGQFLQTGLSSHNYYIQMALQTGLIGLGVIWLLLFNVWKIFYYGKNSVYVRLAGSYFISALVYQLFEVSLTQNNLSIGILIWLIISIGVNKSIEEKSKMRHVN